MARHFVKWGKRWAIIYMFLQDFMNTFFISHCSTFSLSLDFYTNVWEFYNLLL